MLLRYNVIILSLLISLSLQAASWSIVKKDKSYSLESAKETFELVHNGEPKIVKIEEKDGLKIIDYYSGDYGTSQKVSITRRIVITDKMQKIADDILFTKVGKEKIDSKWDFDFKNKVIKVYDPDLDITKNYPY